MRSLLALLAGVLWPARRRAEVPRTWADAYLEPLIVLLIGVVAGPDLIAFVELTTLLELLGATMFLLAFAVAYRMLAVKILDSLRRLLVPLEYSWLLGMRKQPSAVFFGVLLSARPSVTVAVIGFSLYIAIAGALRVVA